MEALTNLLGGFDSIATHTLNQALLALLMAFILGQLAAWLYIYTHAGLSYSRAFVQSIVLLTVVLCLGMMVIGNNIAIAFGLIGALAVIRFRNILKDTRDTSYIFFTLIIGLATGTHRFQLAILGSAVFCLVAIYLHWTQFGSRKTGDGFMRFRLHVDTFQEGLLQAIFKQYCRASFVVSQRFQETGEGELSYRIDLKNTRFANEFVRAVRELEGISNVSFVLQEDQGEL
ncbi:MAG: DUF4956 domain-containing protein [Candidatus Hydrogenedentota bacterium]